MWCIRPVFIIIIFHMVFVENLNSNPPDLITVEQGTISGRVLKSGKGNDFYAFQEIPYAAPPTGKYRFQEPREPQRWSGILNTTKNSKICMQHDEGAPDNLKITEDCLYLNVYSPTQNRDSSLPVLFWIHGGKFLWQSGAIDYYDPKYLMDYNIIVVTFNYRLGAFGFLTTSDGVIPGNLALKDQLLALRWVHNNIHHFGGDKNSITVTGTSAGAASAAYMQQSRLSRGLVKAYIIESGSCISPDIYQDRPDHFAYKMGKALDNNFNSKNSSDLLELLQKVSAEEILNAKVENDFFSKIVTKDMIWIPTLESSNYKNAFVTSPMVDSLLNGNFEKVPMLMGTAGEEVQTSMIDVMDELVIDAKMYDKNPSLLMDSRLNVSEELLPEAGLQYKRVYTSGAFENNTDAVLKYLGEDLFSTPTIHHAVLASKYSPVYFFQFTYKGQMGEGPPGYTVGGHAESLHYIFGGKSGLKKSPENYPETDQRTMSRLLRIWTNFVKYQNPTPRKHELCPGLVWPCVKEDNIQYFDINAELVVKKNPKHYKEVKKIFNKYARPPHFVF